MFKKRLAIVHDALINTGGAERTLVYMSEAFPDAPIFTSVYLPRQTYPILRTKEIHSLPGSRFVHTERLAKQLYPVWVLGFAGLVLDEYDIVLTSTSWVAKFVRPPRNTLNVSYCYAPTRFLWHPSSYSESSVPFGRYWMQAFAQIRPALRRLDYQAMQNPQRLATTSQNMAKLIAHCYDRTAQVIHAPIRVQDYMSSNEDGDYYLVVGRLISHKRVDIAIEACRALKRRLVIVGEGPERAKLEAMADDNVRFVKRVSDIELLRYYANCRAVLFPSNEDYGLVPLEAQASGRPVIAYEAGGVLETVSQKESGIFFQAQTADSMVEAILEFESRSWDARLIRQHAERFDLSYFKQGLIEFIGSLS